MYRSAIVILLFFFSLNALAQTETIDNKTIIELSRSGLSADIILKKIASSRPSFDVSVPKLIELKNAGVDEIVITAMMEGTELSHRAMESPTESPTAAASNAKTFSESGPGPIATRETIIAAAKTIAFGKSSLQPSRQALEKELMKRADFQRLNLTILRYKEAADLFVDIGFVSGSWVTHRYVYRIYDRRSGAVITAGETTSWGSLAENLARHIAKSLTAARAGKMA